MQITKEILKEKSPCSEGFTWFLKHFPEGGEYQDILDELAKENRADWASWLISKMGSVNTVLEVESIETEASIFFAGSIVAKGIVKVARWLISGEGIEAV